MSSAVDPLKSVICVAGPVIPAGDVYLLFLKSLWRSIPTFLLLELILVALVMVVRQAIALDGSLASKAIHGRVSISVEDGSLVQARRKADNQEFSIGEGWSFVERPSQGSHWTQLGIFFVPSVDQVSQAARVLRRKNLVREIAASLLVKLTFIVTINQGSQTAMTTPMRIPIAAHLKSLL